MVEAYRDDDGKKRHNTLFRLGEASVLRQTGELDRIIAALQAHAERRYVDLESLEFARAPSVGTIAAVQQLWEELDLSGLFDRIEGEAGCAFTLGDAIFAMLAGRLLDPASKRYTHRWIGKQVIAPQGFTHPSLDQYYRALDELDEHKDVIERHVYARVCDLTNLNLTLACYDLTSSYLEGDPAAHDRFPSMAFGDCRDHRSDRPQIVIGLLTSTDGIPIVSRVLGCSNAARTRTTGVADCST